MYNFQKVGVWVQVRISRCIKCEETTNYMLVDIYMLSTFYHFYCYDVIGHVTRADRIIKFA